MKSFLKAEPVLWGVFALTIVFFFLIGYFGLETQPAGLPLLAAYNKSLGEYFSSHQWLNGYFLLAIWIIYLGFKERFSGYKWLPARLLNLMYTLVTAGVIIPAAALVGLLGVFLAAYINLNIFAYQSVFFPDSLGLLSGGSEVLGYLNNMDAVPKMVITDDKNFPLVVENQYFSAGHSGGFYNQYLIHKIPESLVSVSIPKASVYVFDQTLVFTGLNAADLKAVSPRLGYLMVKNYFNPRYIKAGPLLDILGRQDYLKLREDQVNKQVAEIDKLNSDSGRTWQTVQNAVAADNTGIADSTEAINSATKMLNLDYQNCMAAGYYDIFVKKFIPYHDEKYCRDKAQLEWGNKIQENQKSLNDLNVKAAADKKQLDTLNYTKIMVTNYRTVVANQISSAPDELGLFHDQNQIDMVLDWVSASSVQAYLQSLVHEYLHYTSYVSDQTALPKAFEEGLTEYYARQVMGQETGSSMQLGYPLLVKIISQMAMKIPLPVLQEVYFTKDTTLLATTLDRYFGNGFYASNNMLISVLPYLDEDKALATANSIMKEIGGPAVTENDLFSEINSHD